MAAIDFTADEENAPGIDFIPDAAPAVAETPRPIAPPPGWAMGSQPLVAPPEQSKFRRFTKGLGDVVEAAVTATPIELIPGGREFLDRPIPLLKEVNAASAVPSLLSYLEKKKGLTGEVAGGLRSGLENASRFFESPRGIGTVAAGIVAPPTAARSIAGAFTGQMAAAQPEATAQLVEAIKSGDPRAIATTASGNLANLAMIYGGAKAILPSSIRELAKEPSTTGAPNAIQERQATEVYGGVPEQPRINEGGLPTAKSTQRVPPGNVPPRNAPGTPRAEEAGAAEVPLKEVTVKARTPAGEEIGLKMEAGEAQRRFTQRKTVLEALRDCMG